MNYSVILTKDDFDALNEKVERYEKDMPKKELMIRLVKAGLPEDLAMKFLKGEIDLRIEQFPDTFCKKYAIIFRGQ